MNIPVKPVLIGAGVLAGLYFVRHVGRTPVADPGIEVLEKCKADKACYLKAVSDTNGNWFAREKAAFELAKLAAGDAAVAEAIAQAYKVREVVARVSMALLTGRVMRGKKCQKCADILNDIMKGEKGSTDVSYQKAVFTARETIAKLSE